MRRSRFSEEQIIGVLKEAEAGIPVLELCRKHGVTEQTYYLYGLPPACKHAGTSGVRSGADIYSASSITRAP